VSPHVVSYLLAVAGVLNRSVCPADSLPPVPSLEYAEALGIITKKDEEIPNMIVTIRGSLLGEALTSISQSLKEEIISTAEEYNGDNGDDKLKKCSPSSLVQLLMDVKFVNRCLFERNTHGFYSLTEDSISDSRQIMDSISERLAACVGGYSSSVSGAISERHSQVFVSCDLFLSSLFGEDDGEKFSSAITNGATASASSSALSSSQSFSLNPLPSSRRFILLPIQAAEKSLAELQLRGKYGKNKAREEKETTTSGNALGTGFGFLSSMLTKR